MTKREKEIFDDLIDFYEFQVIKNEDKTLSLIDLQGANLGGICDEVFKNEWEIIERMNIYHLDYIIRPIEDEYEIDFDTYKEYLDFLIETKDENNNYSIEVLKLICKGEIK